MQSSVSFTALYAKFRIIICCFICKARPRVYHRITDSSMLQHAFSMCDMDGGGSIDETEMMVVLQASLAQGPLPPCDPCTRSPCSV